MISAMGEELNAQNIVLCTLNITNSLQLAIYLLKTVTSC